MYTEGLPSLEIGNSIFSLAAGSSFLGVVGAVSFDISLHATADKSVIRQSMIAIILFILGSSFLF